MRPTANADAALAQKGLHAARRIEAEAGAAGEHDGVDALDRHLVGLEQIGLPVRRRAAERERTEATTGSSNRATVTPEARRASCGVADADAGDVGDEIARPGSCAEETATRAASQAGDGARGALSPRRRGRARTPPCSRFPSRRGAVRRAHQLLEPLRAAAGAALSVLSRRDHLRPSCRRATTGPCAAGRSWPRSCSSPASRPSSCCSARPPRRSADVVRQYLDVL